MKREDYERRTEELLAPITQAGGYEVVDVEYVREGGNRYLRAYVDKPGGITVDDCEAVSRLLSDRLDEEDFIAQSYYLEVSSPGLMRPLRRPEHFTATIGMEIEAKLYQPRNGQRQLIALLTDYQDGVMTLTQEEESFSLPVKDCAWVKRHDDIEF